MSKINYTSLYLTKHSRDFYRGQSIHYSGKWTIGSHYICDNYEIDFVVHNNVLLACSKSHLANIDNKPTDFIYDERGTIIGINSDCWDFVLAGILGKEGKIYLPSYNKDTGLLTWHLISNDEAEEESTGVEIPMSLAGLKDDENHRVVTDVQISSWEKVVSDLSDFIEDSPFRKGTGTDSAVLKVNIAENIALGLGSVAEGVQTKAIGNGSHTEGLGTIANNMAEHAFGVYNKSNKESDTFYSAGNTLFSIGMGFGEDSRGNAVEVMQNSDVYLRGIGDYDGTNPEDAKTLKEVIDSKADSTDLNDYVTISDIPIEKGSGQNSVQQKGTDAVANAKNAVAIGEGTKAQGTNSFAEGSDTLSGQKGYKYTNTGNVTNQLTLTSVNGLSVGDVISIVNDSKYPNCSTITEINGNTITLDSLPFDSIVPDLTGFDDYLVYVSAKPNVGDVDIAIASHAEGTGTKAQNYTAHAEGRDTQALGSYSHAEGRETIAQYAAHAEGKNTQATGECSHSEGFNTIASGNKSHAEGNGTISDSYASHTEGYGTVVSNNDIPATINNNVSGAAYSHAEGNGVSVTSHSSHGEGRGVKVTGNSAHGEGLKTIAAGNASHAEGNSSVANGSSSHAEGHSTITQNLAEHAEGRYNRSNTGTRHSVGIGTSDAARKNAFEIMENGDAYLFGVGGYNGTNPKSTNTLQQVLDSFITKTVSDLTNYYTKSQTYTKEEVMTQITNAIKGSFVVVASLPTASADTLGKIYLVPSADAQAQNIKDEYITIESGGAYSWEKIGSTAIDLSGYATEQYVDEKVAAKYTKPATGIPAADLSEAVQESLEKADNPPTEVFWAEYGVTTAAEIDAAVAEEKAVMCIYNDFIYTYISQRQFVCVRNDYLYYLRINDSGIWGSSYYRAQNTSNRVSSWQSTPDNNHYPSEKLVKDSIDSKYTKPSTGIPATDIAEGVIPDVSQFITRSVNDLVNYYLKSEVYTKDEVAALIGAIQQFHYEIAASTSAVTTPSNNVLYLIGPSGEGADKYEEYVYSSGWVKIGDTSIDLSGYVTTSALNAALANYATNASLATVAKSGSYDDLTDKPIISTNIKNDKTSDVMVASPKAVYDEVHPAIATAQPSGGFLPNVMYVLGELSGNTTFALASPNDANVVNHYYWTFETSSSAPTITWPAGISWFGGSAPNINISSHYEISVLNNIAVFMEV